VLGITNLHYAIIHYAAIFYMLYVHCTLSKLMC